MCIAFFQGKGYSEEFTAHMREMIHKFENNPAVCISAQADVICSKCPNNKHGICETESKVAEYDRQVLERCGLFDGMVMPYAEYKKAVFKNILLPGMREEICYNCQWNPFCEHTKAETSDTSGQIVR